MFTEYKSPSFYVSLACSADFYHLRVLLFTHKTAAKFIACLCLFQRNVKHYSDHSSSSLILLRFHCTSTLRHVLEIKTISLRWITLSLSLTQIFILSTHRSSTNRTICPKPEWSVNGFCIAFELLLSDGNIREWSRTRCSLNLGLANSGPGVSSTNRRQIERNSDDPTRGPADSGFIRLGRSSLPLRRRVTATGIERRGTRARSPCLLGVVWK